MSNVNNDLTCVLTGPASFTGRLIHAEIPQVGIIPESAYQMHLNGSDLVCKWFLGEPGIRYQVSGYVGQSFFSVGNNPGIPIRKGLFLVSDGLHCFQVNSGMVVNINGSKACYFQAPFGLIGATGPIPTHPGGFLAGFADIAWIKGNGILPAPMGKCKFLVKCQEIKWLFELLSVSLFLVKAVECGL